MIELNIDEVLKECTKKELYKVVEKLTGSKNYEIDIEPGSNKGDNFMGNIFRIQIKRSRDDDNDDSKDASLILKCAPTSPIRRERIGVRNVFLREITMYDEVLSFFDEFQRSKGIDPKENGFNEYSGCYSTITEEIPECLFLEDLKLRQFDMMNLREEPLTFDHMSLMMKALGKFHAISFALKTQQPNKFKELSDLVFEQYWTMFETEFKNILESLFSNLVVCLEKENRFDLLEKIKRFAGDNICATILKLTSSSSAEPYAVICHGDVTTNNSMFRKDNQGKPIEVQLIDWQFCRYASPITELVLYLLCSTTKELRDKHYDEFLTIYHESLSDLMTRLGSNPNEVFPFEALLEQCRKFGAYAAFVGAFLMPMVFADRDSVPDVDEIVENGDLKDGLGENVFQIRSDEKQNAYNKRVTEMFDDMERFGYI